MAAVLTVHGDSLSSVRPGNSVLRGTLIRLPGLHASTPCVVWSLGADTKGPDRATGNARTDNSRRLPPAPAPLESHTPRQRPHAPPGTATTGGPGRAASPCHGPGCCFTATAEGYHGVGCRGAPSLRRSCDPVPKRERYSAMPDSSREADRSHDHVCSECLGCELRSSLQEIIGILTRMEQAKQCGGGVATPGREVAGAACGDEGKPGGEALWDRLTDREREAVELLLTGASNRVIARRMDLSERTVKNHLQSAYRKLRVRSRAEAILKLLGRAGLRRPATPPRPRGDTRSPLPPPRPGGDPPGPSSPPPDD
ncbi:helix-turn-helix transcriptional regulator [Streptomyces fradiae]|uniref:helix-turn-helix transcriptional regulator n=1 Tax=Streptomyces fradiae TaxID=1906 RepID=UPI002942C647|nr:LuxR C-terminal-related transcriptional regulator [Streptomyces fradiae]WOI61886.1 LuxR C-terminal-related transcriptional regulator [Streptomyces fradiae]